MSTKQEHQFNLLAGITATVLSLAILLVIFHGDRVDPKVKEFNLNGEEVSVNENQLVVTFNREMNRDSVENSFNVEPAVDGKFSWAGRKLYYTLNQPLEYGQSYQLSIDAVDKNGRPMIPFLSSFSSFEKELFYIEAKGDTRQVVGYKTESGVLTKYTPKDLFVVDYDFIQGGKGLAFLGVEERYVDNPNDMQILPDLYTYDFKTQELNQLTNDENILNFSMKVAPDGETIAMQRIQLNPETGAPLSLYKLWLGNTQGEFEPYWYENLNPDDYDFTPDSTWLLVLNTRGYSLLPIKISSGPPQLLGNFVSYQGFSEDGKLLAFVQWKDENVFAATSEVVLMHRDGNIENILTDIGEIESLRFNSRGDAMYVIISKSYEEANAIYKYDLNTQSLDALTGIQNAAMYANLNPSVFEDELAYELKNDSGSSNIVVLDLEFEREVYNEEGRLPKWR